MKQETKTKRKHVLEDREFGGAREGLRGPGRSCTPIVYCGRSAMIAALEMKWKIVCMVTWDKCCDLILITSMSFNP